MGADLFFRRNSFRLDILAEHIDLEGTGAFFEAFLAQHIPCHFGLFFINPVISRFSIDLLDNHAIIFLGSLDG